MAEDGDAAVRGAKTAGRLQVSLYTQGNLGAEVFSLFKLSSLTMNA